MTDKPPPQWAIDKAIEAFGEDECTGTLYAAARLIVDERDLARSEIFEWLRNNMTFYNTGESDRPVLASVSSRIWYHATDSTAHPFDKVIEGEK